MSRAPTELILSYHRMPGDAIVLTSLVRDLKKRYPNLQLDVRCPHADVFKYNPHLTKLNPRRSVVVELSVRPFIKKSSHGERLHFIKGLHDAFLLQTHYDCPVYLPKGDLHFGPDDVPLCEGPYWVVVAGGKPNITIKHWSHIAYQQVVSKLTAAGVKVVQVGAAGHKHAKLEGAIDLVGKTTLRQFLTVIRDSSGVICPVTAAMHAAAALDKPCVVIGGGREEPWWEEYSNRWPGSFGPRCESVRVEHRFLDTLNKLPCCQGRGCWKKQVVSAGNERCKMPDYTVLDGPLAKCMSMITPDDVVSAVMSYNPTAGCSNEPEPEIQIVRTLLAAPAAPRREPVVEIRQPLLDHPVIGGKLTICALLYGDHNTLHTRLLTSIMRGLPLSQIELRLGLNEVCANTRAFIDGPEVTGVFEAVGSRLLCYRHDDNAKKYPVMRQMFHDPEQPLSSSYVIWFDDDSYAVQPNWLAVTAETIINNHEDGYRLYGAKFKHSLRSREEAAWFQQGDWYRGRQLQNDREQETPNGDKIWFVAGGFWACASEVIRAANIPDPRLYHNGGDITIGEQVHQSGYRIKAFNTGKVHIHTSGAPRRGYSETFPWRK